LIALQPLQGANGVVRHQHAALQRGAVDALAGVLRSDIYKFAQSVFADGRRDASDAYVHIDLRDVPRRFGVARPDIYNGVLRYPDDIHRAALGHKHQRHAVHSQHLRCEQPRKTTSEMPKTQKTASAKQIWFSVRTCCVTRRTMELVGPGDECCGMMLCPGTLALTPWQGVKSARSICSDKQDSSLLSYRLMVTSAADARS
jgi:hypothetical protein